MLILDEKDRAQTEGLLAQLCERYSSAEDSDLLFNASLFARNLPWSVQNYLNRFRREEWGYARICGHAGDDGCFGPTPSHWNQLPNPSPTLNRDILLVLYGALLGDVFGWATQQDGRVVHDVLPIKANEGQQLGTAANVELCWHTEDAFHPLRPDWIILACIRNPTSTATMIACVDDLTLSEDDVHILFEERFRILPDDSHLPKNNSSTSASDFSKIETLLTAAPSIALMSGDPHFPYLRADESFWCVADPADTEAAHVLNRLTAEIQRNLREIRLDPGDFLFLDNFKAVHGRKPFAARYDGTDRWLKRVCVTRDLRKSRAERVSIQRQIVN
jgi:Fe(II)/alpha-ketoglutarate-dependent arginine beta-hydroxylase